MLKQQTLPGRLVAHAVDTQNKIFVKTNNFCAIQACTDNITFKWITIASIYDVQAHHVSHTLNTNACTVYCSLYADAKKYINK